MAQHKISEFIMFLTSLVVGLTMVMGVNAVNSAPSFMLDYYKYIQHSETATPHYDKFWVNILTYYTVVTLVAQAVHEPTNLTYFMSRFSLMFRMQISVLLMLVELIVIVVLPHTGASEAGAMAAIIIVAYLGGVARAYFENTGYALFGPCPSKMLSGMLVGSAASGALVSIIQIILKASMPDTYDSVLTQSIIYFSLSLGIIFLGAVGVLFLLCNPFAKQYIAEFRSRRSVWRNIYCPVERVAPVSEIEKVVATTGHVEPSKEESDVLFDDRVHQKPCAEFSEGEEGEPLTTAELIQGVSVWRVIKEIWPMMLSCLLTFGVTYLMYPGMLLAVDPEDGWYTTIVMTVYNFGDLIGRAVSMIKRLWVPRKVVLIASVVRIVFIPLLILCAAHIIPSHAAAYVFTAVLSVSNGSLARFLWCTPPIPNH
ncbi:solute carrier family 29 (equilibrative nucleoside transporter), member 1/2/3 [Angomonas deanei]|uniref:Nucleoside transporter, putative n=1 Tax=Angomonas deanei TaxID=59799 RepID=A0A7G2CSL7_9TRYP|nr:solute carrier family 29 (equilibrative nucleoside transporter), member 1/2/3 [Angomonas deanei]CAD2222806.1 Nucleoside transporter, putative [Angomonas deanei]|eukprot:EPY32482.1 solute carrier family 29 (equilibrative nucleoside transporter), member 1/2/3 [Angomonas deanei]